MSNAMEIPSSCECQHDTVIDTGEHEVCGHCGLVLGPVYREDGISHADNLATRKSTPLSLLLKDVGESWHIPNATLNSALHLLEQHPLCQKTFQQRRISSSAIWNKKSRSLCAYVLFAAIHNEGGRWGVRDTSAMFAVTTTRVWKLHRFLHPLLKEQGQRSSLARDLCLPSAHARSLLYAAGASQSDRRGTLSTIGTKADAFAGRLDAEPRAVMTLFLLEEYGDSLTRRERRDLRRAGLISNSTLSRLRKKYLALQHVRGTENGSVGKTSWLI